MGIHEYPCPTCFSKQRVKAQAGEVVEIKDCEACAQLKEALDEGVAEEVEHELDAYASRRKKQR